jgi:integrase
MELNRADRDWDGAFSIFHSALRARLSYAQVFARLRGRDCSLNRAAARKTRQFRTPRRLSNAVYHTRPSQLFHDLRHTFGIRAADAGADAFTIAELMGHSDLRMTKRYTHATDSRKRAVDERLVEYGRSEENCLKFVTKEKREA